MAPRGKTKMHKIAFAAAKIRLPAIAALALLTTVSSYAAGPLSRVDVGNWHGGSYTNDNTGKFSHCAASASYQGGMFFYVAVSNNFAWRLAFQNET
jgi:hypothetical protein